MHWEIFGELPEYITVYLLYHDVPELKVGDPPYPIKKDNPVLKKEMDRLEEEALQSFGIELPQLTENEKLRVKICDALDCWEYAREEIAMGNSTFHVVVERIKRLMEELIPKMTIRDTLSLQRYWTKMGLEGVYQ
jgi:5'-deoxynucleotidase YfbR-like HD superfamily hydrolase